MTPRTVKETFVGWNEKLMLVIQCLKCGRNRCYCWKRCDCGFLHEANRKCSHPKLVGRQ